MGIIYTKNEEVRRLKGLHLYHGDISNCSMRIRMALEEKRLPWVSHHLDLRKNETRTPEYFSINPYGLVPALVDDGVLVVESDDILEYIESKFPDPALLPAEPTGRNEVHRWLKLATSIHIKAVKTIIYNNKMRGVFKHNVQDAEAYARLQKDPELIAFHRKSASPEGFSEDEIANALATLDNCWSHIEAALSEHEWMVGNAFSLADIMWAPLHFTLTGASYEFDRFPRVQTWAQRLCKRSSFQQGVLKWCAKF